MSLHIVHQKVVFRKSRLHSVEAINGREWHVGSGTSGNDYTVCLTDSFKDGAVTYRDLTCTCDWGTWGLYSDPDGKVYGRDGQRQQSACSHVCTVIRWIEAQAGRKAYAHESTASARRQHRPIINPGDGMLLTSRKASNPLREDVDYSELI